MVHLRLKENYITKPILFTNVWNIEVELYLTIAVHCTYPWHWWNQCMRCWGWTLCNKAPPRLPSVLAIHSARSSLIGFRLSSCSTASFCDTWHSSSSLGALGAPLAVNLGSSPASGRDNPASLIVVIVFLIFLPSTIKRFKDITVIYVFITIFLFTWCRQYRLLLL